MRTEKKELMQLNENMRFLLLTLGVFCLMLGVAVLLLALVEELFFGLSYGKPIVILSGSALALGGLLLGYRRWRLI